MAPGPGCAGPVMLQGGTIMDGILTYVPRQYCYDLTLLGWALRTILWALLWTLIVAALVTVAAALVALFLYSTSNGQINPIGWLR